MAGKRNGGRAAKPKTVSLDELLEKGGSGRPTTATDPAMRDGNSSHGSPYDTDSDFETTDNDVGDAVDSVEPLAGPGGGAVGGALAGGRSRGGRVGRGITSSSGGDSTIGSDPKPRRKG